MLRIDEAVILARGKDRGPQQQTMLPSLREFLLGSEHAADGRELRTSGTWGLPPLALPGSPSHVAMRH